MNVLSGMSSVPPATLAAAGAALLAFGSGGQAADEQVRFNRDVRPILSDKCFHCHGPDSQKREADLRLDVRANAVEAGAITPGRPEDSEMLVRLLSKRPKEHMPPPKAKLAELTPDEIDIIRRWIAEGAQYEAHWSFTPPVAATSGTGEGIIDAPVRKHLAARGLAPQPEADRATLLRRVSFDLTGLPPTPAEVTAFLSDPDPQAYEKIVDRLLASPRFGERMAVDWLDIARYADSYGFQVDREREVWPWRDWVVKAFNENLPFDQFITWQVAGDLLPNATDEQILATTFNRLHQQETEGGSVEEEYRVEYVADRVQTFATAFLGLTFECARCHDHKFDPITHRDYYQLASFFQNIDEAGLYSFFTESTPTPTLGLKDAAAKAHLAELQRAVSSAEQKREALSGEKDVAIAAWLENGPAALSLPGELAGFGFDWVDQGNLANWMQPEQPAKLRGANRLVPGHTGSAVEFSGDDPVDLPVGNFHRYEPFSISLWLKTPEVRERAVIFHRSRAWTDAASRGYELLLEDGRLKWSLIHFWPGNAVSVRARGPFPQDAWTHVVVTWDGSSRASGLQIYVNGQPAETEVIKDALTKDITGGGGDQIALGERFRDRGLKGGAIDEFRVFSRALRPIEALAAFNPAAARTRLSTAKLDELRDDYPAIADADFAQADAELKAARMALAQAEEQVKEIMVMRELPAPKPAFVLFRGQYDQRREEVFAATPVWLSPWPQGAPKNRLGLARWITDPAHPLTGRVVVNRFWQNIFGLGLVKTPEDFGSQSELPLYPEVLDGLARRFVDGGWNTKDLLRTIVLNATYRQRSLADEKTMADDPKNEWLARGPRFRLSAEMIRDNVLAAAGLLREDRGGPPVNPYEMSEAFKPVSPSVGGGVYRRSLYTTWRRTSPPPGMVAFDAPRRAVCSARRERTDSPLQALILLNGTQYVEAARALGEQLQREYSNDLPGMIQQVALRCLGRLPDAQEVAIASQLYQEQLAHFEADPTAAASLLKVGSKTGEAEVAKPALAAATILAQTFLNHAGSVVKR